MIVLIFTVFLTRLLMHQRPIHNIMTGTLLYAIGFGLQGYGGSYAWFLGTVLIWTIGEIIISTNSGVFVTNQTPINQRGRYNSLMGILHSSGNITSSLICGAIIQHFGFRALWTVVGLTAFVAFLGYALVAYLEKQQLAPQMEDESAA